MLEFARTNGLRLRRRVPNALLVALGLLIAVTGGRAAQPMGHGLRAQYFEEPDSPPVLRVVDTRLSTTEISRRWRFAPPDRFSIQWSGHILVDRPGLYTFATTSDDGSLVYVDRRLVVDNGGSHSAVTRQGQAQLGRGPHAIVVQYSQDGGEYRFEWSWAGEGEPLRPIPSWVLSPTLRSHWTAQLARGLDLLWWASAAWCLLLLVPPALRFWQARVVRRAFVPQASPSPQLWGRHRLPALALFVSLAALHTWPLVTDLAHLSRNDNADTLLNEWTLAWVAHQLANDPVHLFDANIFYPDRDALAYSEALVVQGVMGAPLLWLGASPVLTYNLLLLAGLALTGWTMCLVVARWTGDWVAGVTSGVLMAFNAHTLTRLPHLQALHVEFLPLALLALDALLRGAGRRTAVWLGAWVALQSLTSVHLLVFTVVAVTVATLARPEDWLGGPFWRLAPKLTLAAAVAGVFLVPFLLPYWRLHEQGIARSLDEVASFAASWRDYLTTNARVHEWLRGFVWGTTGLFPGLTGLALVGLSTTWRVAFHDPRARMCLAFGICGVLLSFGPLMPGYAFLYSSLPLLQGIRAVSRFGYLSLVAVAIVGGFGMAALRQRLNHASGWRTAVSGAVLVVAVVEPLTIPNRYRPFDGIPRIYAEPSEDPGAVVAELPFPRPALASLNVHYMLNSTANWKPLLNGYSGIIPASYHHHYDALRTFPSAESVAALRAFGVTHVFVHVNELGREEIDRIAGLPELRPGTVEGAVALYRVAPAAPARGSR